MVPIGLLLLNWIATIWGGTLRAAGGALFRARRDQLDDVRPRRRARYSVIPVGWQLDNTTAAQGDTIAVLVGGAVLGGFAALHYWFPKLSGRTLGEGLGKIALVLIIVGLYLYVIPMFFAGLKGQPVDIYKYFEDTGVDGYNLVASIGAFVLATGILIELGNAAHSWRQRDARARPRPVGRRDARVVRALAAAGAQLRRGPGRPQRRAAPRHPRGDREAHRGVAPAGP